MFLFLKSSFSTEQEEQWELPHAIPFSTHTLEGLSAHQVLLLQECQCLWWAPARQALSWGLKLSHIDHKPPNKKEKAFLLTTNPIRIWADVVLFSVWSWHISHMNHSAQPLLPSHTWFLTLWANLALQAASASPPLCSTLSSMVPRLPHQAQFLKGSVLE